MHLLDAGFSVCRNIPTNGLINIIVGNTTQNDMLF